MGSARNAKLWGRRARGFRRVQPCGTARLLLYAPSPIMNAFRNRILDALPATELERLTPHLERVPLVRRMVVYDPVTPIEHVYFVETGLISIGSIMRCRTAIETR